MEVTLPSSEQHTGLVGRLHAHTGELTQEQCSLRSHHPFKKSGSQSQSEQQLAAKLTNSQEQANQCGMAVLLIEPKILEHA